MAYCYFLAIVVIGHIFSIGQIPVLQFNKWHEELGM